VVAGWGGCVDFISICRTNNVWGINGWIKCMACEPNSFLSVVYVGTLSVYEVRCESRVHT
jgi:hypothetical protein